MTWPVLQALLGHWRRHPFQMVTLILGLALATALWSGVQAINAEARASYDRAASAIGGGQADELISPDGPIPLATYAALRRAGWRVSPVVEGWVDGPGGRVRLIGIDPLSAPPGTPAAMAAVGIEGGILSFIGPQGALLATPATAERLEGGSRPVRAVEGLAPGLAFADLPNALALLDRQDVDRLVIHPDQPLRQSPLTEVAPGLERARPATADDLGRLTDSFHLNLTAFGLLSFAVGLFIVNGAVGLAFEQRRPMFRTLRALGVSSGRLVATVVAELLVFALVAGLIGVALGYLIAAALLPDVAATLRGLYGAAVEGTLTLSPVWWLSGLAIAVAGTALAAVTSLWGVARLTPLASARPRAWARANRQTMLAQLAAALLALMIALGAGVAGHGLLSGFILLGGLLIAAALALPAALTGLLALAGRQRGTALREWFWADTRQQVPGLSLALMALLLALAANIGVGTMVQSFRDTFTGWLDQRLASELYVTAETEAQAAEMLDWLDGRTDAVLPIWDTEGEVLGAPAEIYGVVDHPTYRDNWPLLDAVPDVWDRIGAGQGALVNEQLARREGLAPGDPLPMPGGWTTEVTGIYSDYGNPLGQVILPNGVLIERYPDVDRLNFGLRIDPARVDEITAGLEDEVGLPPDNMVDQAALKAFSLDVFERTFAVTGALNVLTLAVAGVAILTSLLTLANMRLPQLAPVWALGVTRDWLARIELLRSVILAALTFVLAIPVGLVLAWVLLAVINVEAFGWRLPMHLYPLDWLWLGLLSAAAAGLAGLWPARRLASRPPSDLIRVFSNER
ncbi:FtsX-like permease family protein [Alphaproteobacteria bacterium GH1-50]|uniref:FtsX-like permease family protein n=1 Tax=Kangsaoukella pontilimi TaxID=2691042 RepID=A0A7C9NCM7_9RHOB|nr:ABC transporter permease [Kangsaoukella pontilimi]MXQ06799.1 FtsX-like permease family protein [Kangsaoukella pontilimi]